MDSRLTSNQLSGIKEIAAAINQLAVQRGFTQESVISRVEKQVLDSQQSSVKATTDSLVAYIEYTQDTSKAEATLVVQACRIGHYLNRGGKTVRIPLDHRDNTIQEAVDLLFDGHAELSTTVKIGGESYTFDPSIKYGVYHALMEYLGDINPSEKR